MPKLETESTGAGINLKTEDPAESIEALQSEASRQLKKILDQNKAIKDFKSYVDSMMAHFHDDESLFGQVALWYGNLSWWVKSGHIAAIGSICCVSIVLGLAVLVLYSSLALLFTDYYNVSEKRDKRLRADITALEKSLAESVDHISSIEDSLKKVFTSLCEMNIEKANDIAVFKAQISQLETQIQLLTEVTTKVSQTKDSLVDSTAKISQSFEKATSNFDDLNESVSSELDGLKQTDDALSNNIDLLTEDHNLLSAVNVKFEENNVHLTGLAENLSKLLGRLKINVEAYESSHDTSCKTTPVEIDSVSKTKGMITHADDTMADALKVLKEYQGDQKRAETNASSCETGKSRELNVANLLARAKNAISSQSQVKSGNDGLGAYSILLQ